MACAWLSNTACITRLNLSMRQQVAAVGRRVTTLCKGEDGVRPHPILYHGYYTFGLPHACFGPFLPPSLPSYARAPRSTGGSGRRRGLQG